jgi:ubiquinone/menaquinone biosynthesis C-methylase UbiE
MAANRGVRAFDDLQALADLDRRYSTPALVAQRKQVREIIRARPGETGLDVGCGPGFLSCELAADVAPGGRIVAIDTSAQSVKATAARAEAHGLAGVVEVRVGDAASLEFADETFDFVVATQVYCYVADVGCAVREAARVLRKGGRLVVLDTDWDFCAWASSDPALTRCMVAARGAKQFVHAHLPRELHRLLLAAGLRLVGVRVYPMIETRYDPDSFGIESIDGTRDAALADGVPAAAVAAWEQELRARQADGEWFFCLNRFIFTATK